MFLNLLLTDPDNVPDIIFQPNPNDFLPLLITAIALLVTICAGYIISKQHKQIATLENRNGKAGSIGIWITTTLICILFISLCVVYCKNA